MNEHTINLNAAMSYAARGWKIFPLFYVLKNGRCSCRKEKCTRIGKHPITRNGLLDATTDEAQIRQWWTDMPYANIGLATGHGGRVVIDVDHNFVKDKKTGEYTDVRKVGQESLAALVAENEPLPETLTMETGGEGQHLHFMTTEDIPNSAGLLGKDIDVRGHGGYVVLPPSNHDRGTKYKMVKDVVPADLPDWILKKLTAKRRVDISEDGPDAEMAKQLKSNFKLSNEQLVKLLKFIPADCDRDTWWKVGAALKRELGDLRGWEVFDEWSQTGGASYDPSVARRHWDSFEDKGITGGTIVRVAKDNGFRGFDKEAADAPEIKKHWVYVASIKRFVETSTLLEWDNEQFNAVFLRLFEKGRPAEHVLRNENFKIVPGATYWPQKARFVIEDGSEKLNYWRPSGLTPWTADVSPFLDHVRYLWPEGAEEGEILLDYLAFQVQHPGEKVHWAVLIEGDQGTGKSYFAEVMKAVLGKHNVRTVTTKILHEAFTGWQRNTQFIVVEEMMARQRLELMNTLKPMITESWAEIREMYKPPYEQPNRFNFLFFSNHADALIIDNTDRRYCILKTKAKPHPAKNNYYGPLFDWTRKNAGALLQWLQNRDLSKFHPKSHAPMTEGKRAMVMESMLPLDAFIYEKVEAVEYPFRGDLAITSDLVKPLAEFNLRPSPSPKEIAKAFARLGYEIAGRARISGEKKANIWVVRNADRYRDLDARQLLAVYISALKEMRNEDTDAIFRNRPRNPVEESNAM